MTASQHHSQRHMGAHLAAAPGAGFDQRFVDCDMPQTSLDRGRVPPIGACMRWVRTDIGAAFRAMCPKCRNGSPLSDRREVIVTMNEYEERCRPPTHAMGELTAGTACGFLRAYYMSPSATWSYFRLR